jgi:uncharacterized protein (UPF0264 family)
MTGLLVSVRCADEALAALEGGADLIDIKEPARGALGAARPQAWKDVAALVAGRVPVSAALGELVDSPAPARPCEGIRYVKLGLAGCGRRPDWAAAWGAALSALPPTVQPVAVAYADWRAADAPAPWRVLDRAAAVGCAGILLDTFDKRGGDLFQHLDVAGIEKLVEAGHSAAMFVVIAGSLTLASIDLLVPLAPNYIAVRRAICVGGREGRADSRLIREWAERIRGVCQARLR